MGLLDLLARADRRPRRSRCPARASRWDSISPAGPPPTMPTVRADRHRRHGLESAGRRSRLPPCAPSGQWKRSTERRRSRPGRGRCPAPRPASRRPAGPVLLQAGQHDPERGDDVGPGADRHRHRAGTEAHLLHRGRVVVLEHPRELAAQGARLVDGVRRDAGQVREHLGLDRGRRMREQHLARHRWRASAAASRSCSPPAPTRARRAGRGRAPGSRRARRGGPWRGWRRTGRGGTARPAAAARSARARAVRRPRAAGRRRTPPPSCGSAHPTPTSSPTSRWAVGTGSSARSASSDSVSRRCSSSNAPTSARARLVTLAPGVETLPAMEPSFHSRKPTPLGIDSPARLGASRGTTRQRAACACPARMQSSSPRPARWAIRKPDRNASPAPLVSTMPLTDSAGTCSAPSVGHRGRPVGALGAHDRSRPREHAPVA